MASGLLPFDAALERLLGLAQALPAETVAVADAAGRHLAEAVTARLTQPPADVSAMDGYALRFAELPGPFRLVGESAAGRPLAGAVGPGEAARIFTGAFVPEGADTVAVQEDAEAAEGLVRFPADGPPHAGAHIRRRGQDFSDGQPLAEAGMLLTPARLGLLAAAGHGALRVHRRPRIALLSTGDELVPAGELPGPGQIVGSNALMLAALLQRAGADVEDLGIVADRPDALAAAIARGRGADLLVTVGGASVGNHDLVKPCLEAAGASLDFWRIAIRPGKPLMAGRLDGGLVVGLPGNPVSAYVCARLFLAPLIRRLSGNPEPHDRYGLAKTMVDLPANGVRRDFLRGTREMRSDGPWVTPATAQDSSLLTVLAAADVLLVRPEHGPALPAGTAVPVLTL
jgi:molybdopterin molybdotransferase